MNNKTFEMRLNEVAKIYMSSISYLKNNGKQHGAYMKNLYGNNWFVFFGYDNGFIGEPMDGGWFCYEFDSDGKFNSAYPMFYNDLDWCINHIKDII